jgi:hypothetical protein
MTRLVLVFGLVVKSAPIVPGSSFSLKDKAGPPAAAAGSRRAAELPETRLRRQSRRRLMRALAAEAARTYTDARHRRPDRWASRRRVACPFHDAPAVSSSRARPGGGDFSQKLARPLPPEFVINATRAHLALPRFVVGPIRQRARPPMEIDINGATSITIKRASGGAGPSEPRLSLGAHRINIGRGVAAPSAVRLSSSSSGRRHSICSRRLRPTPLARRVRHWAACSRAASGTKGALRRARRPPRRRPLMARASLARRFDIPFRALVASTCALQLVT